jgi:hypothetical protein
MKAIWFLTLIITLSLPPDIVRAEPEPIASQSAGLPRHSEVGVGVQSFTLQGLLRNSYWRDLDLSTVQPQNLVMGEVSWSPLVGSWLQRPTSLGLFVELGFAQQNIALTDATRGTDAGSADLQTIVSLLGVQAELQPRPPWPLKFGLRPGIGTITYLRKTSQRQTSDSLEAVIYSIGGYAQWRLYEKFSMFVEEDWRGLFNSYQLSRMDVPSLNTLIGVRLQIR